MFGFVRLGAVRKWAAGKADIPAFVWFSNLDLCDGETISTAIFNSDITLSVQSFSCFMSVAVLKATYAEHSHILFCLVDIKNRSFLASCVFWFVFLNASSFRLAVFGGFLKNLINRKFWAVEYWNIGYIIWLISLFEFFSESKYLKLFYFLFLLV